SLERRGGRRLRRGGAVGGTPRLPGDGESGGGRRRTRHPRRRACGGTAGRLPRRGRGGGGRIRRRAPLRRTKGLRGAARRDPDRSRYPRAGVRPGGARLLGATAPSEGDRGGAAAGTRS